MTTLIPRVQALILVATLLGADGVSAQPAPVSASPVANEMQDDVRTGTKISEPEPTAKNRANGNPLWAVPLATLTATRERPIFAPTRRPPPVVSVRPTQAIVRIPERLREPERPQLLLIGTILGEKDGFGVFVDDATKGVVRLRRGDAYQGWVLRTVQRREATLEKDDKTATLSLPRPSEELAKSISRRSR
jgi:hypothetical protein